MSKQIKFTKMVASGNDFVVIENSKLKIRNSKLPYLAKKICDRKYGVGADGLLALERSKSVNVKMRIFNADGSEAEMCGNGARCVARYLNSNSKTLCSKLRISTKAGIIEANVKLDSVKIKLNAPCSIKSNMPIRIGGRSLRVNFVNTGVPHVVVFVQGLEDIDVFNLGKAIRYHEKFSPRGTNVNFVEIIKDNFIKVRTYERGVEDETLACGTGSVASAVFTANNLYPLRSKFKINVLTKSGEILKVYFNKIGDKFTDVWLDGKAKTICRGGFYV
jgi:diaminopimelate epimerase